MDYNQLKIQLHSPYWFGSKIKIGSLTINKNRQQTSLNLNGKYFKNHRMFRHYFYLKPFQPDHALARAKIIYSDLLHFRSPKKIFWKRKSRHCIKATVKPFEIKILTIDEVVQISYCSVFQYNYKITDKAADPYIYAEACFNDYINHVKDESQEMLEMINEYRLQHY